MRLEVRDILGIEEAEIAIPDSGVVEVIGPNAAGKSSLATAAQAVLAHDMNPLCVPAPQAKRVYVRDGAEYGEAALIDSGQAVKWRPAAGTIEAVGKPYSRPESVGLVDYTARIGAKARAEQIQAALLPPASEILAQVREALVPYLPADDLDGVMQMVDERGFEAASEIYADRARRAKREWRSITGLSWGIKAGGDWLPVGWQADYDHLSHQQAQDRVTAARDAIAAIYATQAVSESEIARAREAAAAIPGARAEYEAAMGEVAALHAALDAISPDEYRIHTLEKALEGAWTPQPCPLCGGDLSVVDGGMIVPYVGADGAAAIADEMARERAALDAHHQEQQALKWRIDEKHALAVEAQRHLHAMETLARQADSVPARGGNLADAQADLERAQSAVQMIGARAYAEDSHQTIIRYSEAARALGAQGVRAGMLTTGINRLNKGLAAISEETGWPEMLVDDAGRITWEGRPVQLCSESEKWRAQAAMQLTLAALTGSRVVVLDRGDVLDKAGRAALVRACERVTKAGIGVLLCSTGSARGDGRTVDPWPWPIVRIANGRTA